MKEHTFFFHSTLDAEKYFEAKYADRFTPNNVIGKLFPELSAEVSEGIDAPPLRLTLEQSDRVVAPR